MPITIPIFFLIPDPSTNSTILVFCHLRVKSKDKDILIPIPIFQNDLSTMIVKIGFELRYCRSFDGPNSRKVLARGALHVELSLTTSDHKASLSLGLIKFELKPGSGTMV